MSWELATVFIDNLPGGLATQGVERLKFLHDVHALDNGAEHVPVVQPADLDSCDKELAAISVGPGIGHRQ